MHELPTVFWLFTLIGISISHDLFFHQMRRLKLYNSSEKILKFAYFKHGKNADFHQKGQKFPFLPCLTYENFKIFFTRIVELETTHMNKKKIM